MHPSHDAESRRVPDYYPAALLDPKTLAVLRYCLPSSSQPHSERQNFCQGVTARRSQQLKGVILEPPGPKRVSIEYTPCILARSVIFLVVVDSP